MMRISTTDIEKERPAEHSPQTKTKVSEEIRLWF